MKKGMALLLALCMAFMLCACGDTESEYLNTDQTADGGTVQDNANLKDISVSQKDNDVIIRFEFVNGSVSANGSESPMTGLPQFSVSFCQNPTRLVVSVKDLAYWEYQQNSTIQDSTGLVQGSYKVIAAGTRTYSQVYFNLSSDVEFNVQQEDGALIIVLRKKAQTNQQSYYVVGNLFYEYQQGSLGEDAELIPTLTDDYSAVVMISQAYGTQEEAEQLKARIEDDYGLLLIDKSLRIFQTQEGALPTYSDGAGMDELNQKILINKGGVGESANVYFADARLLCLSHDSTKALYARKEIADKYETEKLFLVTKDGERKQLFDYETTAIAFASFSPDDRYILYVEQVEGAMLASIYDLSSQKLISVDEEFLGTFITGTAWSADSASIYMMAGYDIPRLQKVDVASGAITDVLQEEGIETQIYCAGDYLYYCVVRDVEEAVVRLKLSTLEEETIGKAEYFTLGGSGKYLLMQNPFGGQEAKSSLSIMDTDSKTSSVIIEDVILGEYFFSNDGKKVYFTADADDDVFTTKVYQYDIESNTLTELFSSITASFMPSWNSDELSMCITYEKNSERYPATYIIKTN